MKQNNRIQKLIALCLVLILSTSLWLSASGAVDLSAKCSIRVLPCGSDSPYADDLLALKSDIYRVAGVLPVSGYDTYTFAAVAGFEDLREDLEAISDQTTGEDYAAIAQKAAAKVMTGAEPLATVSAGETAESLAPGLYLILAHDDREDYWVTNEETGTISTSYESDEYVYRFAPVLVSVPSKEADEDGNLNTANPGEWLNDVTVILKPEQTERFGKLEIIKTLSSYETSDSVTCVFSVEATLGEKTVYSDVVSISFTDYGQKSVLIDRIPVGAEVVVTELYSGSAYTLVSEPTQTVTIAADTVAQALFENKYDEKHRGGHGITNNFTQDGDGWHWNQLTDSTQ